MGEAAAGNAHPKILGVVGTFVLDRIVGLPGRDEPTESLGGIAYALCAVGAVLPGGWTARPVARVGDDAAPRILRWVDEQGLPGEGLEAVPEPNNRVELRYRDAADRTEHLQGGVGGWRGEELAARVAGCDALLVNFISGHELTLEGVERLRGAFAGPIYADLHSLFLDTADDGTRVPRRLPRWRRWMACFDAVQMNESEMGLLRGTEDADAVARAALDLGPGLLVCTRGSRGVVCWAWPDVERRFTSGRHGAARDGSVERREIPAREVEAVDPTGCGDVWGAAMCCRLLAGEPVGAAARSASRIAAAAARRSGVEGLVPELRKAATGHARTGDGLRDTEAETSVEGEPPRGGEDS